MREKNTFLRYSDDAGAQVGAVYGEYVDIVNFEGEIGRGRRV